MKIILRGGKVIDGTGRAGCPADLVIEEGRIGQIGAIKVDDAVAPDVIDVSGMTVLPGLIDCHIHIALGETLSNPRSWVGFSTFLTEEEAGFLEVTSMSARQVAAGHYIGVETLRAGFTTVRDLGASSGYSDIVLREAFAKGYMPGPRLLASGGGIAMTGGHGWDYSVIEVDGADAVRAAVRRQLKAGADVIKLMATRAGLTRELPGGAEFSLDEMRIACEEAHQRGKHVAAHAVGAEGIKRSVLAGVDTIEHGCFIDEEGADLMLKHGATLVSTLHPYDRQMNRCTQVGYPPYAAERSREIMEVYSGNLRMAMERGVPIVLGSDSGIPMLTPHGENAREIILFAKLVGVKPVQAIHCATGAAAVALGLGDDTGTLEKGKRADIVVMEGDVENDLELLLDAERIKYVVKEGVIVVKDGVIVTSGVCG